MAKKSFKLVKASAALAVTAAALTPVMAAEASTSTVELKAEVVLGGKFKEALALNTPAGVEIKWGKYLVTAINKWQTVKGQGSDGKTYIKKLYARNYPLYILDQDLGEVEAGSELEKPSIRVMYRDGKVYTQAPERYTMSSTYNTKDEGEQKVLISYNHNGNRITSFLTYTVVAGEVEFDKVMSSVDQAAEVLSVTADVKNLKEGEKVELVVYPGKDMSAQAITETATVKDGKLTVSKKLPAGTHSFQLVSGEVKTEVQEFTIEAPMVKSVEAISAKRVEINFNKAIDPASLFNNGTSGALKTGTTVSLTTLAADNKPTGSLSYELINGGKTILVTTTQEVSKRYDVHVGGLETKSGDKVAEFKQVVNLAADTTAPYIVSTSKPTSGTVKVVFSEPLNSLGNVTFKKADGTIVASGLSGVSNDFVAGNKEVTFTLGSSVAANELVIATLIGAQDEALNLINPNPATINLYKGAADGVAPAVSSINQTAANKFAVKFSEELQGIPTVTVNGAATTVVKDSSDASTYIVTTATPLDGASTVVVSNFTDLSGVTGTQVSRVVNFVKDTVAPKLVSSKVVRAGANNKEYLEMTFDKDLVVASGASVDGTGAFVKNFVTTALNGSALNATPISDTSDKKVVRVELDTFLGAATTDVKDATYTLDLTFSGLESASGITVGTPRVTFVRGEDGTAANTTVVNVSSISQGADNDKVEVVFDKAVDGASATNVANYSISGAVISSVTLLPVSGTTQTAVLNLANGSNGFTGVRNITVNNVKALGSTVAMAPYFTNSVSLSENVKPTVTSAKLTSTDSVTVNFSEAVINSMSDSNDFELYIGGVKVSTNDVITSPSIVSPGATSAILTLEADVTAEDIAKGLVIKSAASIDMADAAGNKVSVPTAGIAISQ
ncbi:hypothetical protein [Exiguobacterium sp.]|uniref:hypothetical protein n=1 Tax=Exiguobacterium sp. TaxID=44751 RepID=UPI00307D5658